MILDLVLIHLFEANSNKISSPKKKKKERNAENAQDTGSVPGSGRSPGGGNGKPLQYSCLENPMDRGDW